MKVIRHRPNLLMAIIEHRREKAFLSRMRKRPQEWIPLFLKDSTTPFAEMHLWTYQVRLCGDHQVETAQQVFLPDDREEESSQTSEDTSSL